MPMLSLLLLYYCSEEDKKLEAAYKSREFAKRALLAHMFGEDFMQDVDGELPSMGGAGLAVIGGLFVLALLLMFLYLQSGSFYKLILGTLPSEK